MICMSREFVTFSAASAFSSKRPILLDGIPTYGICLLWFSLLAVGLSSFCFSYFPLYNVYRHNANPVATYSGKNSKVFQSCCKPLVSTDLRLRRGAAQALTPYRERTYVVRDWACGINPTALPRFSSLLSMGRIVLGRFLVKARYTYRCLFIVVNGLTVLLTPLYYQPYILRSCELVGVIGFLAVPVWRLVS